MKKIVACFLAILICLVSLPLVAAAEDEIAEGYTYHSTLYYDEANPYNNVHGNANYAYQCYTNSNITMIFQPLIFVHNGTIVRDSAVNQNLLKMYFVKNYRESNSEVIEIAKKFVGLSTKLKFTGIVSDIGSAASQSLGAIGSVYLTGGTVSVGKITSIVAEQTVEQLTSHICDVSQIFSDAQLTYFYLTTGELKAIVKELEKITDFTTFANCEKYADYMEQLYKSEYCAKVLTESISVDLADADTFLEVLGQFAGDVASGFVGDFAEFVSDYNDFLTMQQADPDYFSKIISVASAIANCEDTLGDFGNVLLSAVEYGLGDSFTVVNAYKARKNAVTPMKNLTTFNAIGLRENPSSDLNVDNSNDNDTDTSATSKMTVGELQAKFPHGKYWNHTVGGKNNPDGVTSTPCSHHNGIVPCSHAACAGPGGCCYYGKCPCNSYANAIQCMGFALKLGYDAFGSNPRNWTIVENRSALDTVKPGDIIRYNGHSIFVTAVNGNTITFADCNAKGTCQIRWNQTIKKSNITNFVHIHVAPAILDNTSASPHIATDFNPTIQDGIYTLKIAQASEKMLTVSNSSYAKETPLVMWSQNGSVEQKFYFKHESGGKYRIYAVGSGRSGSVYKQVVDVHVGDNGSVNTGDVFDLWPKDSSWDHCQLFYIVPVGEGKYVIELASTPRAVLAAKLKEDAETDGGAITLRAYKGYVTQEWYFYDSTGTVPVDPSVDASSSDTTYYTGTYKVDASIGLNIRNGAGTPYKKLGTLTDNTTVSVEQVVNNWGKITHNGVTGWICLDYTTYQTPLVSSVSIKTPAQKTIYLSGETVDTTGLSLTVTYSDNTTETVTEGFTCTPSRVIDIGAQTIFVEYHGAFVQYDVTVSERNYTITYDANGGSSAPSSQTKSHGLDLTISSVIPVREGYTFVGWAMSNDATTADYSAGEAYTEDSDVTLYAVWQEIEAHTCVFDQQNTDGSYQAADATCQSKATYYYSCVCGEKGTQVFEHGNFAEHLFTNYHSNGDATYTQDGTKTAKCDHCTVTDTKSDVGSALGLTQKFKDEVLALTENADAATTYAELYALLQTYSSLSESEKSSVSVEFAAVQQMIREYNAQAESANDELAEATEIALAPLAAVGFSFVAALWFLLKKKFWM